MSKVETFEDLDTYKIFRDLRIKISKIVQTFPDVEKYRLIDQIIRASRSITANIAEGYGRYHYQENTQFCRQARGSAYELLEHINVALDEKYISTDVYNTFRKIIFNGIKTINGYVRYLQKQKLSTD
ncbi:MAG: four helix bundle protein [bacterium]